MTAITSTWTDFHAAEPAFAAFARRRFEKYAHHVLATVRGDGSPRLSGLGVAFVDGELWCGMMPNSRKGRDLLRDPRFALHANPGGDDRMADGDVRIAGRAVAVTDAAVIARYAEATGTTLRFDLFRAELTEVVETQVDGVELVLRRWSPGRPARTVRRGS
ncbi:pyridoxamine 5'-phosphate oxidase family protein [Streptomyces sp. NPDC088725]|uniref:pyridoxamine 5'-phosphate oxidase family protein n=1 Tax=Streptomyces sp. NPDC088725 TaxID=3365873 RepID=UPI00382C7D36